MDGRRQGKAGETATLAAFVRGLGGGATCFCCGRTMRVARGAGKAAVGTGGDVLAVCAACGSEIGALVEAAHDEPASEGPAPCATHVGRWEAAA